MEVPAADNGGRLAPVANKLSKSVTGGGVELKESDILLFEEISDGRKRLVSYLAAFGDDIGDGVKGGSDIWLCEEKKSAKVPLVFVFL